MTKNYILELVYLFLYCLPWIIMLFRGFFRSLSNYKWKYFSIGFLITLCISSITGYLLVSVANSYPTSGDYLSFNGIVEVLLAFLLGLLFSLIGAAVTTQRIRSAATKRPIQKFNTENDILDN